MRWVWEAGPPNVLTATASEWFAYGWGTSSSLSVSVYGFP